VEDKKLKKLKEKLEEKIETLIDKGHYTDAQKVLRVYSDLRVLFKEKK